MHLEKEKIVIKVSVCGSVDEHTAIMPHLTNRRILKKGMFLQVHGDAVKDYDSTGKKRSRTE